MQLRQLIASRKLPMVPVKWSGLGAPSIKLPVDEGGFRKETFVDTRLHRNDSDPRGRHYVYQRGMVHHSSIERILRLPWSHREHIGYGTGAISWAATVPSVTTILDKMVATPDLDAWREAVGEERADAIAAEAATKGQLVHLLCEQFLLGIPFMEKPSDMAGWDDKERAHAWFESSEVNNLDMLDKEAVAIYHMLRGELQQLDEVHGTEVRLMSMVHGFAGTVDIVGTRRGKHVIADIKTYRKLRTDEQLQKAFIQMALYALAVEDSYDFPIEELVCLYANPIDGLQVQVRPYSDFKQTAIDYVAAYHLLYT
jgi:PD-(D/E)XK nuclease superfamily